MNQMSRRLFRLIGDDIQLNIRVEYHAYPVINARNSFLMQPVWWKFDPSKAFITVNGLIEKCTNIKLLHNNMENLVLAIHLDENCHSTNRFKCTTGMDNLSAR